MSAKKLKEKLSRGKAFNPGAMLPPISIALPSITGLQIVDNTLGINPGAWASAVASFTYQWNLDGSPIEDETNATYVVAEGDIDGEITCEVTAVNASGTTMRETAALVGAAVLEWEPDTTVDVEEGNTAAVTAPEATGGVEPYVWTIAGGADDALFEIDDETGDLVFADAPAFDTPLDADEDNVYEVTVVVTDALDQTVSVDFEITVTEAA